MKKIFVFALAISLLGNGCKEETKKTEEGNSAGSTVSESVDAEREKLMSQYTEIPDASAIINAGDSGAAVYAICQQRYAEELVALKKEADAIGARLVVTILSPEVGEAANASLRKGVPFILDAAKKAGIDAVDFTAPMAKYTPQQLTQMPKDGHWSADGAKIVAAAFQPVIAKYGAARGTKTFSDNERPKVMGDLEPNQNAALDGGKDIPYQLITNSQGFRMEPSLAFPKTKQRILFIGDSQIYSPFLDNNQIATALLQQQFPDKEIINAGVIGYTLDDCTGLVSQKASYAEPDVIILVTNPNDIGDFYFTQRNRMSRSKKAYLPTASEIALYNQLFPAK